MQALQDRGIRNIDVGCMQVNLKYHGKAFSSLDEAFEPEKNAAYSAQFLRQLYKRNKQDWTKTAMHYHSRNLRQGTNYKNRLEKHYAEYVREEARARNCFSAAKPQSCFRTARLGENFKGGHQNAKLFRCCV